MFNTLNHSYPTLNVISASLIPDLSYPRIRILSESSQSTEEGNTEQDNELSRHLMTVKSNERITSSDWLQDVRHIEFTFGDEDDIWWGGSYSSS